MIGSQPLEAGVDRHNVAAPCSRRRLELAVADVTAGPADLAVLFRCVIRSEELARRLPWQLQVPIALARRAELAFPDTHLAARLVDDVAFVHAAECCAAVSRRQRHKSDHWACVPVWLRLANSCLGVYTFKSAQEKVGERETRQPEHSI